MSLELCFPSHRECETLTRLAWDRASRDRSMGRARRYRKGADVWRMDDQADRIYVLQRGQVSVRSSDSKGREFILHIFKAGEPFGELCFCAEKDGLRETSARADAESHVSEITLGDFVHHLQKNSNELVALLGTFCLRLADIEGRLGIFVYRTAHERLGHLLLHLARTSGGAKGQPDESILLSLNHQDLAEMAGMSRPHVSVTMGKFRRLKLVEYTRGSLLRIAIPSLQAYLLREGSKH